MSAMAAGAPRSIDASHAPKTAASRWRGLYLSGVVAMVVMIALMPVQIITYVLEPPPGTVVGWFEMLNENWLLGLLSLDLLYMLSNTLLIPIYLAWTAALRRVSESAVITALVVGSVGVAAYYASNPAFEMLSLAGQYARAVSETDRTIFLAAGTALMETYKGTVFDAYYLLSTVALLIYAVLMLRSGIFGRVAPYAGLLAGVCMIVPSSAGQLGAYMSLASLIPWVVLLVLTARHLLRFARGNQPR
jgi:hypothetical protein